MWKKLSVSMLAIMLLFMLIGCGAFNGLPSICDEKTEPSILCDIAEKNGIRLENVAFGLIASNAILINQEAYSNEQAVSVLKEMRKIFNNPTSYLFAKKMMNENMGKYPGMVDIADSLLEGFTSSKIMYSKDRKIMIEFFDSQIDILEN